MGIDRAALEESHPRGAEVPFDAGRRRITTAHRVESGWWIAVKGALGSLSPRIDPADKEMLAVPKRRQHNLPTTGYRVLALAERYVRRLPECS